MSVQGKLPLLQLLALGNDLPAIGLVDLAESCLLLGGQIQAASHALQAPPQEPFDPRMIDGHIRTGFVLLASTPDRDGRPRPISGSTIRYRVARMAAAAGVVPSHRGRRPRTQDGELVAVGPHRLRHGYGTELAERYGVDAAQAGLRHASLATTGRYLKRRDVRVRAFAQEYRLG